MKMQKILIFGGTGFIGRSLANHLQEKGFTPILVARNQPDPSIKHQFLQTKYSTNNSTSIPKSDS